MNFRDMKKALKQSLEIEEELYEFAVQALKELYGEYAYVYINDLDVLIDQRHSNFSCIDFGCVKSNGDETVSNIKKYKEEKEE